MPSMTQPNIVGTVRAVASFRKLWTDALLKDGDLGLILPSSHERVVDHVR